MNNKITKLYKKNTVIMHKIKYNQNGNVEKKFYSHWTIKIKGLCKNNVNDFNSSKKKR